MKQLTFALLLLVLGIHTATAQNLTCRGSNGNQHIKLAQETFELHLDRDNEYEGRFVKKTEFAYHLVSHDESLLAKLIVHPDGVAYVSMAAGEDYRFNCALSHRGCSNEPNSCSYYICRRRWPPPGCK